MQIMIKFTCSLFMTSNNVFCKNISHINKHLKIHQLNFIKIITKDLKKKLVKDIKAFLKRKRKKVTTSS